MQASVSERRKPKPWCGSCSFVFLKNHLHPAESLKHFIWKEDKRLHFCHYFRWSLLTLCLWIRHPQQRCYTETASSLLASRPSEIQTSDHILFPFPKVVTCHTSKLALREPHSSSFFLVDRFSIFIYVAQ